MKNKLFDNLPLKLFSLLIAFVIWIGVVTVNDPIVRVSYDVPVQVINEAYIASGKKTYQIEEYYQTVLVTIVGNSSQINRISPSDITVTADMTQIVNMETNPVYVPLKASCRRISNENITTATTTIPIQIENVDSARFPVIIDTGNTKPAKNYEIGSMKALPENVAVSGPESLIHKISSIIASVDVTEMSYSGTVNANLTVIDKNQDVMSDAQMEFLSFDSGSASVDVQIDLWRKKSDVELKVEYSGVPGSGFQVANVTTTPARITVSGTDKALAELEEAGNTLIIPARMISVDKLKADTEFVVDLEEVLEDNPEMKIALGSSSQITVHIVILSNETKGYSLDVDQIQIRNLAKNLTVSFDSGQFEVRVRSDVANSILPLDQIRVSLDCSGYGSGDYAAQLIVTLPDGFELTETPTITIHLKETVAPALSEAGEKTELKTEQMIDPVLPAPPVIPD